MDYIEIKCLQASGVLGVYPEERGSPRDLLIDLDFSVDASLVAAKDEVGRTLDYGLVREAILSFVKSKQYYLLETLAENLAQTLLQQFSMQWLRLRVEKPNVFSDIESIAIVIERGNA